MSWAPTGAGKSTLLRAVMGAQPAFEGRIRFEGREIQQLRTADIVRLGIVYVPGRKDAVQPHHRRGKPSDRGVRAERTSPASAPTWTSSTGSFPRLKERRQQAASTLSGGEQQMVAIGRGLMSNPKILMLDEPSLGLAPVLVDEVLDTVRKLKEEGMTILLVEQNVREALDLADRGYILQTGRIVGEGTGAELMASDQVKSAFLVL